MENWEYREYNGWPEHRWNKILRRSKVLAHEIQTNHQFDCDFISGFSLLSLVTKPIGFLQATVSTQDCDLSKYSIDEITKLVNFAQSKRWLNNPKCFIFYLERLKHLIHKLGEATYAVYKKNKWMKGKRTLSWPYFSHSPSIDNDLRHAFNISRWCTAWSEWSDDLKFEGYSFSSIARSQVNRFGYTWPASHNSRWTDFPCDPFTKAGTIKILTEATKQMLTLNRIAEQMIGSSETWIEFHKVLSEIDLERRAKLFQLANKPPTPSPIPKTNLKTSDKLTSQDSTQNDLAKETVNQAIKKQYLKTIQTLIYGTEATLFKDEKLFIDLVTNLLTKQLDLMHNEIQSVEFLQAWSEDRLHIDTLAIFQEISNALGKYLRFETTLKIKTQLLATASCHFSKGLKIIQTIEESKESPPIKNKNLASELQKLNLLSKAIPIDEGDTNPQKHAIKHFANLFYSKIIKILQLDSNKSPDIKHKLLKTACWPCSYALSAILINNLEDFLKQEEQQLTQLANKTGEWIQGHIEKAPERILQELRSGITDFFNEMSQGISGLFDFFKSPSKHTEKVVLKEVPLEILHKADYSHLSQIVKALIESVHSDKMSGKVATWLINILTEDLSKLVDKHLGQVFKKHGERNRLDFTKINELILQTQTTKDTSLLSRQEKDNEGLAKELAKHSVAPLRLILQYPMFTKNLLYLLTERTLESWISD